MNDGNQVLIVADELATGRLYCIQQWQQLWMTKRELLIYKLVHILLHTDNSKISLSF